MSDGLRALGSVATAEEEQRARAHAEAIGAEARARSVLDDAIARARDVETALADAGREAGATAAERVMNDARCARLRERRRAATMVRASAERALERAAQAVEQSRSSLGVAHGERRVVEVALERAASDARVVRLRKEDDEADEQARTPRSR